MLRLKEKPIEWIKFTAVIGLMVNGVLWSLWYKSRVPIELPIAAAAAAGIALAAALARPRWFRGFYRGGMTVTFHMGQFIGKVLLTVFFFIAVTPLGLLLRLSGKDLLELSRSSDDDTWWVPTKDNRDFDRMF